MRQTYRITIGMLLLMYILAILFSTPGMISASGVSLVASEIQHSAGNEIFVRTKLDFAHSEAMADFPQCIGEWHSISYNWSRFKESLGAELLLSTPIIFMLLPFRTYTEKVMEKCP